MERTVGIASELPKRKDLATERGFNAFSSTASSNRGTFRHRRSAHLHTLRSSDSCKKCHRNRRRMLHLQDRDSRRRDTVPHRRLHIPCRAVRSLCSDTPCHPSHRLGRHPRHRNREYDLPYAPSLNTPNNTSARIYMFTCRVHHSPTAHDDWQT